MTASRKKEPMEAKYKRYWAIGIIIAILVAVLLIWNSGIFVKSSTAATVGDQKYSVAEVGFYYQSVANQTINQAQQYAQYGIDMGYDSELSPSEQFFNEEDGVTYADYFLDTALDNLRDVSILCAQAEAADYTLSEAGQASIQANLDALTMYSAQTGYSESAYLKMLYGQYMTKSLFQDVLHDSILAEEFAAWKAEQFTYTDEALETYYTENAATLDSYEYRYCYINYETEEKTDADGNPIDATDEEIAAAMTVAAGEADEMVAQVQAGAAFNETAVKYLPEDSASSYGDPEYNHVSDTLGSSLSSTYSEWMQDAARQPGDITSIEVANTGYCVVQFLGRDKGEDSYQTLSYRSLPILAETTPAEDGSAAAPTEEQLAAAKTQAEDLLAQWQAGDATAESFAALVEANSTDETAKENGGLVEDANRDGMPTSMTDFLFARGRAPGQAAVVETSDSTGAVTGYQLVYLESLGELRWKYQATNALRTDDYNSWLTPLEEASPVEKGSGAHYVIEQ